MSPMICAQTSVHQQDTARGSLPLVPSGLSCLPSSASGGRTEAVAPSLGIPPLWLLKASKSRSGYLISPSRILKLNLWDFQKEDEEMEKEKEG